MVMASEGTGSPVNMSLGSAASTSLSRGVRSSPSTAAIRSRNPGGAGRLLERTRARRGVQRAGVGHDLDPALVDLGQQRREDAYRVLDEARVGVLAARSSEQRHGDLGEVVGDEVVDLAASRI